ncbi:hypothetical protein pb186bvf_021064 [Paramecium bursaria]
MFSKYSFLNENRKVILKDYYYECRREAQCSDITIQNIFSYPKHHLNLILFSQIQEKDQWPEFILMMTVVIFYE